MITLRPPLVLGACFSAVVSFLSVPGAGQTARFIEPMLLLRTDKLPQGAGWRYEVLIKLDGYRAGRTFRTESSPLL
jgi:hypothetical protein